MSSIPDNSATNTYQYVLDPLSTIIKLAILKNKPVGTKVCIQNNTIILQEPGPFQAMCRYFLKTNKTDLQFMYNPIHLACITYLSPEFVKSMPRIKILFSCALEGLQKLVETYKTSSIIQLCLNYYTALINTALIDSASKTGDLLFMQHIFYKDFFTGLYSPALSELLTKQWSQDKIKIILNLIDFLVKDESAASNVKSLETIMDTVDRETQTIACKP